MTKLGNKILVIGSPGAGKSYFSIKLNEKLHYPLFHLDEYYWKPNWVRESNEEFLPKLEQMLNNDYFIIDGCYLTTLEKRIIAADTIIFLDIDPSICVDSEIKRSKTNRIGFPSYLKEKHDPEFINWIKDFPLIQKPKILEFKKKYCDKQWIIFKTREESEQFINTL